MAGAPGRGKEACRTRHRALEVHGIMRHLCRHARAPSAAPALIYVN